MPLPVDGEGGAGAGFEDLAAEILFLAKVLAVSRGVEDFIAEDAGVVALICLEMLDLRGKLLVRFARGCETGLSESGGGDPALDGLATP